MVELSRPYEIHEWTDGQTLELTVNRVEVGELEIQPRDGRDPKTITVIRLHVPEGDKETYPHYWDMTSARLTAQLRGILPAELTEPVHLRITAIGFAPRTHFSVSRLPERPT